MTFVTVGRLDGFGLSVGADVGQLQRLEAPAKVAWRPPWKPTKSGVRQSRHGTP